MQARTAMFRLGGSGSGPVKDFAYSALLARDSSVTDTSIPLLFLIVWFGLFRVSKPCDLETGNRPPDRPSGSAT